MIQDANPYQTPAIVTEDLVEQPVLRRWQRRYVNALMIMKGFAYGTIVIGSIVLLSILLIAGWRIAKRQDFRVINDPLLGDILIFAFVAGAFVAPMYVIIAFSRRRHQ